MNKLRIFLAEDHAMVRDGLRVLINLQPDMEVIGEAGDGRSAWQEAARLQPDVVVMDISMPDLNGAQATQLLKRNCPDIKVLALSMHEDKSYLRELLKAGASGYVLKRAASQDLISAIRVVIGGGIYLDPVLAGKVVETFVRKPPARGEIKGLALSDRETEVLRLIAQGYSNKEIAAQLTLSMKTVETYKARSMEKLGLTSRADIVRYAVQQGWLH